MTRPLRFLVGPAERGLRLDQALAAVTTLSRRRARDVLASGEVALNGKVTRSQSREVDLGDVIDLLAEVPGAVPAAPPEISILFEDRMILAADKPAGVLSQPAEVRAPGELAFGEQVLLALAHREGRPPFLRLIHRIDRTTSGVLLFARSPEALKPLSETWRRGAAERIYLAVVDGAPELDQAAIEAPIGRDPSATWRFQVSAEGKPAATEIRVRHRGDGWALLECRLRSGRTHQVRVHLAHLGHPVRGDRLYGSRTDAPRPLLHAWRLALPHPKTGQRIEIEAPVPADFTGFGAG